MNDPGRPPKPRSLNLLESLVKEEEAKDKEQEASISVVLPTEGNISSSGEFYDANKQQIAREPSASSFSEFKLTGTEPPTKKQVHRTNPNTGFKGRNLYKHNNKSDNSELFKMKSKQKARPSSAVVNSKTKKTTGTANGRPRTSHGSRRTSSPKGNRPRDLSSDSYSSEEAFGKKESRKKVTQPTRDSFFDSDEDRNRNRGRRNSRGSSSSRSRSRSRSSSRSSSRSRGSSSSRSSSGSRQRSRSPRRSRSRSPQRSRSRSQSPRRSRSRSMSSSSAYSYTSDEDKPSTSKHNGRDYKDLKHEKSNKSSQNEAAEKQRTISESSDTQNFVIVEDNSSSFFSSDNEKHAKIPRRESAKRKPPKPVENKPLLSRKKKQTLKLFQISPDLYIEGKLQQKYSELEELMACSFVDQRSHMTRRHLYQMELLRDQYQTVSRGRPSSAVIIPRSLPAEMRNQRQRPSSGHLPRSRTAEQDGQEDAAAYSTIRSVMAAEYAREANIIRSDLIADPVRGTKKVSKKKKKAKKVESDVSKRHSDSEEETSEKPSFCSKTSGNSDRTTLSAPSTPGRGTGKGIDDHIKYTENERLRKWLKEKDKIYRQNLRAERKKKRREREEAINKANEKLERRIASQTVVKKWMTEKNKELYQKHKEERKRLEAERKEWEKMQKNLPGNSMQIKQQQPSVNRDTASEHSELHDNIRRQQESELEKKQEKIAHDGAPHPPQTKFIYKRPVAGKIKLNMQVRGKSPVPPKPDSQKSGGESDSETARSKQARLSYDDWLKKKAVDDAAKKKEAERQKELGKSDPELENMVSAQGKKRIDDKLNMRKRIDSGIKKFDEETNQSFGGGEFTGEKQRPRSAYRLESDKNGPEEPALSVKQITRPSTAPAARARVPHPKQSAKSPRKAVIPQPMQGNAEGTSQYHVPFPPEKGVPAHVAEKQRDIFAEQITQNLDRIQQEALLQAELIKEGVSTADIEKIERTSLEEFESSMAAQAKAEKEKAEEAKKASINELMYSPRKKELSSDSSDEENSKDKTNEKDEESKRGESCNSSQPGTDQSQYRTFDNLSKLPCDGKETKTTSADDGLNIDIERLKAQVEALKVETNPSIQPSFFDESDDYYDGRDEYSQDESVENSYDGKTIEVINNSASDQPIVGILKESKKSDDIPVPKQSDEPMDSSSIRPGNEDANDVTAPEGLDSSKRRVSFNERTEIFESFEESTSTVTNTPEPEDFDPSAESLDNQPNYYVDEPDWEDNEKDNIVIGEKVSINIGGFELNPTVIEKVGIADDDVEAESNKNDGDNESKSTFITDPS